MAIYTIVKSLNNNLVLATDQHDEELVLFGKGIGFKKKKGDELSDANITKIFRSKEFNHTTPAMIADISSEVLTLTETIVDMGEAELKKALNTTLLFSLADHIQAAIERLNQNQLLDENTLQWEIPFLYYQEYQMGLKALAVINQTLNVNLPKSEASFIALHFVNAQNDFDSMNETMMIAQITKSIVRTIQSLFDISLNKESISYSRFVTHIRYFMNRQFHQQQLPTRQNETLYEIIQSQYPKSYACGLMIREMLKKEYHIDVSDDEMIYLIIHIERVVEETQQTPIK
ncbi:PRD domain-containing protein [Vagococcus lutrae]|uniref:PRD domain-containing protein n=1 Tax=Vagococcus lutrae TaxID=81947 RepID=UPI001FEBDD34|nr:PRD domain-containing protein [Vagococcus lutrae]